MGINGGHIITKGYEGEGFVHFPHDADFTGLHKSKLIKLHTLTSVVYYIAIIT